MNTIIIPVSILAGFIIVGFIFDRFILKQPKKLLKRTKLEINEVIIGGFKGVSFFGFILAGLYFASFYAGLSDKNLDKIQGVLTVLAILASTVVAARVTTGVITSYTAKQQSAFPATSIFSNITKIVVFSIGFLIIIQSLGISIAPILTALGVGGLAVALALQETLSNLFAGIHLIVSKKVSPKDYVKLESGEEGFVQDISWRNTSIRALSNNMIIVPNSKLSSVIVTNYDMHDSETSVLVNLSVAYGSDLERVEKVTIAVASDVVHSVTGGVESFEPFIRYSAFADSGINMTVILRAKTFVDQYLLKHEFIKALHKRYRVEGIEIPFPVRTVHLKQN